MKISDLPFGAKCRIGNSKGVYAKLVSYVCRTHCILANDEEAFVIYCYEDDDSIYNKSLDVRPIYTLRNVPIGTKCKLTDHYGDIRIVIIGQVKVNMIYAWDLKLNKLTNFCLDDREVEVIE